MKTRSVKELCDSCVRVANDINGNPRYVIAWFCIADDYKTAVKVARKAIYGTKYRGKDFGGGVVFQSFALDFTMEKLAEAIANHKK